MYEDLFRKALNIEDPWVLESVDFDPDAKRIDSILILHMEPNSTALYVINQDVLLMTARRKKGDILTSFSIKHFCIAEFLGYPVMNVVFTRSKSLMRENLVDLPFSWML